MLNSINTNIAAYSAQQNIGKASTSAGASIARLSSGDRITRAADDVASLSVGTSLRTQVTSLRQALVNSSQGSSLLQVADGALQQVTDILQRQKSIAVQAGSGSLTDAERGFLNQEFQALTEEIDRIVDTTNFNGVKLIAGALGDATVLADLNTAAAGLTNGATAIQAFDITDGTSLAGNAAAGQIQFVGADNATVLADGEYESVNPGIVGQFDNFEISDVSFGVSATLTATINGIELTGTFADGDTTAVISNGTTRIEIGVTALDLTSASTVSASEAQLVVDFEDTAVYRTSIVNDVDFNGTALEGSTGDAAVYGNAAVRVADAGSVDIRNFQYVSNTGVANTNVLTVEVNGTTFTETAVNDLVTAGDELVFTSSNGEELRIDLTGLSSDITDIRTDLEDRENFLSSLNTAFSRSGGGLNFAVGSEASDTITIQINDTSSTALYGGQSLNVATAGDADVASAVLDAAIENVTAIRADVGALQSRFDFASANVESSLQNQDAARGVLLDADVAAESTAFATAQVQLQAGISVLAQANQLPQNLLKLIG